MNYTVVRKPLAESRLAEIWTESGRRTAITGAANTMDFLLRSAPLSAGESRADGSQFIYVSPLAAYYDVSEADRRVDVWAVWEHPCES